MQTTLPFPSATHPLLPVKPVGPLVGDAAPQLPDPLALDAAARLLESSGSFRITRRLEPRPIREERSSLQSDRSIAIILDTETTGLDFAGDEIVELAMLAVSFDETGIHDVVDAFTGLQQPSRPLSAEIVRLTGLTDDMLAGKSIDADAVSAFASKANLVVAHNASFDRGFVEAAFPIFRTMRWACSATEIPWRSYGAEGAKLVHLLQACGLFHDGHRALTDCHALLEVLAFTPPGSARMPFTDLLRASYRTTAEVRAVGAPFATKELLKRRGYRWKDGPDGTKAWTIEVADEALGGELDFLQEVVYRRAVEIPVRLRDARERFRPA